MLVVAVVTLQASTLAGTTLVGAEPDLVLVLLVALALERGAITGAVVGFTAGLLLDVMTLGTLGVTSLVLTAAGHWVGRYGETTGRGRLRAPSLAAAALSLVTLVGGGVLQALIGEPVSAGELARSLVPNAILAALLVIPAHRFVRVLFGRRDDHGVGEVDLVG